MTAIELIVSYIHDLRCSLIACFAFILSCDFRVGMVSFSSNAFIRFDFETSFDKTTIENNLLAADYQASGTATGKALDLARTDLLVSSAGYRFGKTVVILVWRYISALTSMIVTVIRR